MQNKTSLVVLSLGALAAAQSLSDLSQTCQNGITAVTQDAAANDCLDVSGLVNIVVADSKTSLVTPINNWLTSFCGAPNCSADTISAVVANVTQACASDFEKLGVTSDQVSVVLPYIQQYFGTAKEILCLADTTQDQFCFTEYATSLQDALGAPLTVETVKGSLDSLELKIPKNATCVECTQGILVKLQSTELAQLVDLKQPVADQCGADFAAVTALPSNVIVGTGSNVPKGNKPDGGAATIAAAGSLSALAGVMLAALLA
ncbi:hypothetical protein AURDEDRAFT_114934 [Auricularia subglabra TFB-10046 SS5]|nr:hypothetical protein AURDEDRAFT_114934 [Auricularia subglabra TFB-10046 SS5]